MGIFDNFKKISLINKGFKLFNPGKYCEAMECYDKVLEMDSNNAKAWRVKV